MFKDGVKIREIFPGENRIEYQDELFIKTLPTGVDGCSEYKDFEKPKDGQKVALLLE